MTVSAWLRHALPEPLSLGDVRLPATISDRGPVGLTFFANEEGEQPRSPRRLRSSRRKGSVVADWPATSAAFS